LRKCKISLERVVSRKALLISLLVLSVLLSSFFSGATDDMSAIDDVDAYALSPLGTSGVPAKITVACTPPKVLADSSYHDHAVKVLLQDLYGNPAYAPEGGIPVSISSSDPTIGYTSPNHLSIPAGRTYETVDFYSTYKPGTTTIGATSVGLVSGSATVTTVGAKPYKVQVILAPNKVLADSEYYCDPYTSSFRTQRAIPPWLPRTYGSVSPRLILQSE